MPKQFFHYRKIEVNIILFTLIFLFLSTSSVEIWICPLILSSTFQFLYASVFNFKNVFALT